MTDICNICGADNWELLPSPHASQSVTTSGVIVAEPLRKGQCKKCGLIQRMAPAYLGDGDFYQTSYTTYFDRVGAARYDVQRYAATAKWMMDAIKPLSPRTILDIGCGRGWTIRAMQELNAEAEIAGIEPSERDSEIAKDSGLDVHTGTLNKHRFLGRYDLVYSNNVIQHSTNIDAFLKDSKELVNEDGLILITCPDATLPGNECIWGDQNFSIAPIHLKAAALKVGLKPIAWQRPSDYISLADKQLIVLAPMESDVPFKGEQITDLDIDQSIQEHKNYFMRWGSLDSYLLGETSGRSDVYNYGASMWTYLLRGYCPGYWDSVTACCIDKESGFCFDKKVVPFEMLKFSEAAAIVLGINPANQEKFYNRIKLSVPTVVKWNHLIAR